VGGVSLLPVYAGEIQARALGCAAFAFDEEGREIVDEVGELVITQPMPSMPVQFWGDPQDQRYRESYFDVYPGIWRHGDFVGHVRAGTSSLAHASDASARRPAERHRADALIVNLDLPGVRFFMRIVLVDSATSGAALDEPLTGA